MNEVNENQKMKSSRLKLQLLLEELFESKNVYYRPPENLKMKYPAIVYSKSKIYTNNADDIKYLNKDQYNIIVIDAMPDNDVINKILELPYSSYDRNYIANNLNHDSLILYF